MSARQDLTTYWGVASGSSHAAMRRHYEGEPEYQDAPIPTHLMLNWRTENNEVWAGPNWMVDSGGAPDTIITHGGHPDTISDYLDYLEDPPVKYGDDPRSVQVDYFALRDWPTEPSVRRALGLTVPELQHRSVTDHIKTLDAYEDRHIDAEPMAVLQGWGVDDYLACIDAYKDHGLLTDKVAIGTLCGRTNTQVIRTNAWKIARNLPSRCSIHGFGVKTSALSEPDVLRIFDSVDTAAWDQTIRQATKTGIESGPPGGTYADWVDWNDEGQPRYTARNLWLSYRGYARRMGQVQPATTPSDMRVVTLDQLFRETGAERGAMRVDEYIVAECPSGQRLDYGRPEPLVGPPQDRHCERSEINTFDRRMMLRDQLLRGMERHEPGPVPGSVEAFQVGQARPVPGEIENFE